MNYRIHVTLLIVLLLASCGQAAAQGQSAILLTVQDEEGKPVSQVEAHLMRKGADIWGAITNEKGEIVFPGLAADEYQLTISKPGFEPLAQSVAIDANKTTTEIEFTLIPMVERADRVEVQASASVEAVQTSSTETNLNPQEVKSLPYRPATVTDTLPLLPGVVRGSDGQSKIEGSGAH